MVIHLCYQSESQHRCGALRFSGLVQKIVRPTGVLLLARVAGMILAAVAVQMIADAVTEFVRVGSQGM